MKNVPTKEKPSQLFHPQIATSHVVLDEQAPTGGMAADFGGSLFENNLGQQRDGNLPALRRRGMRMDANSRKLAGACS